MEFTYIKRIFFYVNGAQVYKICKVCKKIILLILCILNLCMEVKANPFNPTLPARPEDFVGRAEQIMHYESRLNSTIAHSPMSMAVVGNRGMGKTSFLAKCECIAEEQNCVVIRFSAIEGEMNDLTSMCNIILAELKGELIKRSKLGRLKADVGKFLENFSFSMTYERIGIEIRKEERNLTPWLQREFRETLLSLWSGIENKTPAIIIMVDEAEVLEKIPGALMFLREVFSRLGEKKCGYQLVLSGKLSFQDKMSERFSPLTRFFHPEELERLTLEETRHLLHQEFKKVDIDIEEDRVYSEVFHLSEGHPYVVTSIGFVICDNLLPLFGLPEKYKSSANRIKLDLKTLEIFSDKINAYLTSEFFGRLYNGASPLEKHILKKLAEIGGIATFIEIENATKKKRGSLSPALAALVENGAVEKQSRGRYALFHNLFKNYLLNIGD